MHNYYLGFLGEQLTRLTELDLFGDDLLGLVQLCVKDAHANALVCILSAEGLGAGNVEDVCKVREVLPTGCHEYGGT